MTIYLYKKTHNKTGLNYLGKTIQDPYTYKGSGKRWGNHINKHGYDVTTEILRECKTNEEVKEWGLYYSALWNVVESREWANLKEEYGDGGGIHGEGNGMFGKTHTEEVKAILAEEASARFKGKSYEELYGIEKAEQLKRKRSESLKGKNNAGEHNPMFGKVQKESSKALQSYRAKNRPKLECPHCGKICASSQYNRWHGDKCKHK
jgi:hypothetical protein